MLGSPSVLSHPRIVILGALFAVCAYVIGVGPTVFWIESFGTLMLSPAIYVTIAPPWLAHPLARTLCAYPILHLVICGLPVAMLLGGVALGTVGFRRNSLALALLASLLVTTVFAVYHFVQPMGFRVLN